MGNLGEKRQTSQKSITSLKETDHSYKWMCWEQLKVHFGEVKAQAKVDSGKLESRPDPDTGKDDKDNKEWKVYFDTGGNKELDEDRRNLMVDEEVGEGKEAQELMASFRESQGRMAGNVSLNQVKTEPEDTPQKEGNADKEGPGCGCGNVDLEEDEDLEEDDKTFIDLQQAPRNVLRNVMELLTNLKEMYGVTGRTKYLDGMQADIGKLIPRFAKLFRQVEASVINKDTPEDVDPKVKLAALKALATKVDADLAEFEELKEAYEKWFPASKKQRKKA